MRGRQLRYQHGKNDSLDAEGAARSVLSGQAIAAPKTQSGSVEMIRHLKIARDTAVKSRSVSMVTLKTLIINAPAELRDGLDQPLSDCCAFACQSADQRKGSSHPADCRVQAMADYLYNRFSQSCDAVVMYYCLPVMPWCPVVDLALIYISHDGDIVLIIW